MWLTAEIRRDFDPTAPQHHPHLQAHSGWSSWRSHSTPPEILNVSEAERSCVRAVAQMWKCSWNHNKGQHPNQWLLLQSGLQFKRCLLPWEKPLQHIISQTKKPSDRSAPQSVVTSSITEMTTGRPQRGTYLSPHDVFLVIDCLVQYLLTHQVTPPIGRLQGRNTEASVSGRNPISFVSPVFTFTSQVTKLWSSDQPCVYFGLGVGTLVALNTTGASIVSS